MLTIGVASTFLRGKNAARWKVIPTRPVDPDELYPKAINGGHIHHLVVRDGRAGRADQVVTLEMKWIAGTGWYPLKRELTTVEAAAVCNVALTTFYRISADLASKKKVFGLSFFDTQMLFAEMALVDELAERVERKRGKVRPGAHAEHCPPGNVHGPGACPHADFCRAHQTHKGACLHTHTAFCRDAEHDGRCIHASYCKANPNHPDSCKDANDPRRTNRRVAASPGWSKERPSPRRGYTACIPDALASAPTLAEPPVETRQTVTEAAINAATTAPEQRAAMYDDERDQIAAERAAGNFVPQDEEVQ